MGLFNFGGSKSSSSSQSTQLGLGYGYSGSGSESLSQGASRSVSGGQSTTTQGLAFEDLFAQLYGGATSAAGRIATGTFTDQANQLFSGGLNFLDTLSGAGNPVLEEQIGGLGEDIGRFFREEINPAITSRAVASGTLGGGRQGVAQGSAAAAAAREFQTGATNLRAQDAQLRQQGAVAGLGALPNLMGIAQAGFGAELAPYQALAQILGGPTTLTQSQSTQFSQASSDEIARAISEAFGENFSYDYGQSTSSSKSKSLSLGFGSK